LSQSVSQLKTVPQKESIPFIDLKAQQQRIRSNIDAAIKRVLDHGQYIMGPEVTELEQKLSKYCGAKHVISCANGTDALALALMAKGIKPGDAVFVPTFTFAATAEVVAWFGATPIFIDVLPDTYNMDPQSLEQGIQTALKLGLKPKCVIPVDLFGQPADYDAIQAIADTHKLWILADAAQSFGASYKGRITGNIGDIAATSFFPAKSLGCYGDGGAIFTNDDSIANTIRSLRVHGQGADKYDNVLIGMNARLDTLQAAILIQKLAIYDDEINKRNAIATRYNNGLKDYVQVPALIADTTSVWAQYTIILKEEVRDQIQQKLKDLGIPSIVYYVKPLHLQTAYKHWPTAGEKGLPVSERLARTVLSLPMHPYISDETQQFIINAIKRIVSK
jgi:dTDP-4-amino-4,6-dideoxygalactose transaminase